MQWSALGKTGEEVSILGLGGFHLLEISDAEWSGSSTFSLMPGVPTSKPRRSTAGESPSGKRGSLETIHGSLRRLGTDCVDLLFFHHVQEDDELGRILAPGGALEAFLIARCSHQGGRAPRLRRAHDGDEHFDRFNDPGIEEELLPLARRKKRRSSGPALRQADEDNTRVRLEGQVQVLVREHG